MEFISLSFPPSSCRGLSAICICRALFNESLHGDQLLDPPLLLHCAQSTPPPLLHVAFQFLVYYSGVGQSVQGAMLVYPRSTCGNTTCRCFAHLLVCVYQAGLELVSDGVRTLLFSCVMWCEEA
jgi:hypothetical protein